MEKFLDHPRHIEFQMLADGHGNADSLGRARLLDAAPPSESRRGGTRARDPGRRAPRMGQRCVDACLEIGYRGAGTFEFLYQDGKFFFIEMNTRVQVEHPVTEIVTGIDIVKAQLAIAAGERLDSRRTTCSWRGHAIECRINAEDPKTFVPSPGTVSLWHPPGGPGIRVDSHMYSGYAVPPYYDSLIAKVIAHGEHRRSAIARMTTALQEIVVDGHQHERAAASGNLPARRLQGRRHRHSLPRAPARAQMSGRPAVEPAAPHGSRRRRESRMWRRCSSSPAPRSLSLGDAGDDPMLEPAPDETPLWPARRDSRAVPRPTDLEPSRSIARASGGTAHAFGIELARRRRVAGRRAARHSPRAAFGKRLWLAPAGGAQRSRRPRRRQAAHGPRVRHGRAPDDSALSRVARR